MNTSQLINQFNKYDYTWFINCLLTIVVLLCILIVFWLASKILDPKHPLSLFKYLIKELKEFMDRKITVGSINMAAILVTLFLGLLIIIGKEFGDLLSFVLNKFGESQAKDIENTNDALIIFLVVAFISLVSVLCVRGNESSIRKLQRAKKGIKP